MSWIHLESYLFYPDFDYVDVLNSTLWAAIGWWVLTRNRHLSIHRVGHDFHVIVELAHMV